MSSSILESCRAAHEDIERCVHLSVRAIRAREALSSGHSALTEDADPSWNLRDASGQPLLKVPRQAEHLARNLIDIARARCSFLAENYENGAVEKEGDSLVFDGSLSTFYSRLRELREAYSRTRGEEREDAVATDGDRVLLDAAAPTVAFSGEEGGGKYLDVQEAFAEFLNLRTNEEAMDYLKYITIMDDFSAFSPTIKKKAAYRKYLEGLAAYLEDFAERVRPLADTKKELQAVTGEAIIKHRNEIKKLTKNASSAEEVEKVMSMDEMKETLKSLSLKHGGTAKQRAQRLVSAIEEANGAQSIRQVPVLEAKIGYLLHEALPDERAATKVNVEKKLALSYEEIEAERMAQEKMEEGLLLENANNVEDSDEEKPLSNPKDIPLGWDGRPIPYWLYKLYGLNHEFKCEICGNATYKGPRAFERHFTDTQHAHGLRCLGISYSKQYFMVTKIEDANRLKERIVKDQQKKRFDPDVEEEYEDAEGNVMNKKTYNDMLRQGLL